MNKHTYIVQQLMGKLGLSYHQAIGAVGSLMQESSSTLDNTLSNTTGSGAFGIAQWLGDRKSDLRKYASSKSRSPADFRLQVDFMIHELQGKEKGALQALKQAKNYKEAAYAWTDKYERPSKERGEYKNSKRENFAMQAHKMIMGIPDNKKQIKMASITDNNSPAYAQAQNLSEAEKNTIIQQYKVQARKLKSNPAALKKYNDEMYNAGYIGFDEAGNWTGFVAEGVDSQMSKNEKRANDLYKAKQIATRTYGSILSSDVGATDAIGVNKFEKKEVKEKIAKAKKEISKLENSQDILLQLKNLEAKIDKPTATDFLMELQKSYGDNIGQKVNFFKTEEFVGGADGKTKFTSLKLGKDLKANNDRGLLSLPGGKNSLLIANPKINFQTQQIPNSFQRDIPAPNFDPALKPEVDAIPGIDDLGAGGLDMTAGYDPSEMPDLTKLNYNSMLSDTSAKDDQSNRQYNDKLSSQGKAASDKASAERSQMTEEQIAEQERLRLISKSRDNFNLQTPVKNDKYDADPSTFKSPLPIAEVASGVIGIALGKSIMDEEDVVRDEELNNSFMSHIFEQRRISEMGMNPTEEAAAKEAVANSYQIGLQNIVQNSSGNRALILGNLANLDNISSKRMSEIALADVDIKQRASEQYGRAMEYVTNFNQQKSVANNERKYQQAVLRSAQGTAVLAGAFKSMSEALGSYKAPNDPENMYIIHSQVKNMGWSPMVKDDGKGTNKWSYSWYENQKEKTMSLAKEEQETADKILALPKAEQDAFYERTSGMTRNQQYKMAKQMFGEQESTQGETNVVDENGQVVSTQPTEQNGATVPINRTVVQNADGTQTQATTMSKTTADGTTASTPQSPNQPVGISTPKSTIFDRMQPEPIKVENVRTSDGRNLNLQKDSKPETRFGIAQNDSDPNEIYAEILGLEDVYSKAKQVNSYYNQFGDDEYERNENIRNALNNNI